MLFCVYVVFSWTAALHRLTKTRTGLKFFEDSHELMLFKFGSIVNEDLSKKIVLSVLIFFSFLYIHSFFIYDYKRFVFVQRIKRCIRKQKGAIHRAEMVEMDKEKIDSMKRDLRRLKVCLQDLKNFEKI